MRGRAGSVVAAVLAVLLGALVLWPNGEQVRRLLLDVYLFGLHRGVPLAVTPEVYASVLNVLAFVPLGWLGVAALRRRPWVVVVVLTAASATVETLQLLPALHREASLQDVATNATGALIGAVAASWVGRPRRTGRGAPLEDPGADELGDEALDPGRDDVG